MLTLLPFAGIGLSIGGFVSSSKDQFEMLQEDLPGDAPTVCAFSLLFPPLALVAS